MKAKTKREFYLEYLKEKFCNNLLFVSTTITIMLSLVLFVTIVQAEEQVPIETIKWIIGISLAVSILSILATMIYGPGPIKKKIEEKEHNLKTHLIKAGIRLKAYNDFVGKSTETEEAKGFMKEEKNNLEKRISEIKFELDIIGETPIPGR